MTNQKTTTATERATAAGLAAKYQSGLRHAHNEFEGTPTDHREIADLWCSAADLWDNAGFPDMVQACRWEAQAHERYAAIREGLPTPDTHGYLAEAYQVPEYVAAIARDVFEWRNTTKGARTYFALEALVEAVGCEDALLYDLAADFRWDFDWEAQRADV